MTTVPGKGEKGTVSATLCRRDEATGTTPSAKYQKLVELKAPHTKKFEAQMGFLTSYADLRPDRGSEIISKLGPPITFFASLIFMDPARTPYTLEFLTTALRFSYFVTQRMKFGLGLKRPVEVSPQVQPMIPTPTHGTLPSGHATEAFLVARLLWKLLQDSKVPQYNHGASWGEILMRQASRIAVNRTVAGVHFLMDSVAGALLGLTVAE